MCSCSLHHDPLADWTCTCPHPSGQLPRIEPAPNYPHVDSGEPPTVVQVTEGDLMTAERRVDELAAELTGNRDHRDQCATTATQAAHALDLAESRLQQANEDVATNFRLLTAARAKAAELEAITDGRPRP